MASQLRKISRGTDETDMPNLKKAALGITSKFNLLNSHRSLVFAAAEEKKVHEALLMLVIARVNASTSLLRWAETEKNGNLKDSIHRLYDVNLMYATVQKEYIEQTNILAGSLRDILQIEAALDGLQKHLKGVTEKKEKLLQRKFDGGRKKTEREDNTSDEISKLRDEEESLKSELEVKFVKAEIFKTTTLKKSLKKIVEANLMLSEKMSLIFNVVNDIVESIDNVPEHLQTKKVGEEDELYDGRDIVRDLAKTLNIEKPNSSSLSNGNSSSSASAVFHVELPKTSSLNKKNVRPNQANSKNQPVQKKVSGGKITSGFKKIFGKGATQPVKIQPERPPLPQSTPPSGFRPEVRRRSRSTIIPPTFYRNEEVNNNNNNNNNNAKPSFPKPTYSISEEDSDYEDYIIPNCPRRDSSIGRLHRSSSESNLNNIDLDADGYSRPWDLRPHSVAVEKSLLYKYDELKDGTEVPKYMYSHAYEHLKNRKVHDSSSPYQDPKDCLPHQDDDYSDLTIVRNSSDSDEDIYDTPYDIKEHVEELCRTENKLNQGEYTEESIYQNTLKILDEIEYVDDEVLRRIQSKPDRSSGQIIVEKTSPIGLRKHDDKINNDNTLQNQNGSRCGETPPLPVSPRPKQKNRKAAILPNPLPSPRPRSINTQLEESVGNEKLSRELLQPKMRPIPIIPKLTQVNMDPSQRTNYENNQL